jgi:hypothetical protein
MAAPRNEGRAHVGGRAALLQAGALAALVGALAAPVGALGCGRARGGEPTAEAAGATSRSPEAPANPLGQDAEASAQAEPPAEAPAPGSPRSATADGSGSAATQAADGAEGGERIYSKVRFLWIRPAPRPMGSWLGYLSLGGSVVLRGGSKATARVAGAAAGSTDCRQWYAIEPEGYLCEGSEATTDPSDPLVAELRKTAAERGAAWPYQYGESLGTPVYPSVPDETEQRRAEPDLAAHLAEVDGARARPSAERDPSWDGVLLGPTGAEPPPPVALHPLGRAVAPRVARGSTIAFVRTFDAGGRSWLLTWDRGVVPADRVRRYEESSYAGVTLDGAMRLPIAFFRTRPRPKYELVEGRAAHATAASWPRHGWVGLTEQTTDVDGVRYLETVEAGLWCAASDATVVRTAPKAPARIELARAGRRTWVDVSVLEGWLVAYEGTRPVFATLISPGRGGIPFPGIPAIDTASTPTGLFTVTGKFLTATMISSSDSSIVHAEVQYTQNFSGPHTLHGAYWHSDWGERKSGGCVNLSPRDARWLFEWSEPRLPPGWHGVRWVPGAGESTAVSIHR